MTGNTKIWRAPLAGLASVAMLATMGVAAATANATAGSFSAPKVSVTVDGRPETITKGMTYADAIALANNSTKTLNSNYDGSSFGGYVLDGDFVDMDAVASTGAELKVKRFDDNYVQIHFVGETAGEDYGYVRVAWDNGKFTVPEALQPYDVADGKILDFGHATYQISGAAKPEDGSFVFGTPYSADNKKTVEVTIPTIEAWTLNFSPSTVVTGSEGTNDTDYDLAYAGAIADGTNDDNLTVEVAKGDGDSKVTYDPANAEKALIIASASEDASYGVDGWKDGNGKAFTAKTEVARNFLSIKPVIKKAHAVKFFDGKTELKDLERSVLTNHLVSDPGKYDRGDGSTFVGWFTADGDQWDFAKDKATAFDLNGVLNLYAKFVDDGSYTVTYKYNDGVTADKTETYLANQVVAEPAAPTRDGYLFAKWYKDDGNGVFDSADTEFTGFGAALNADTVLFAKWIRANDATLEAAFKYIDGSNAKNNNGVFTDASFADYVTTYQAVQKEYAQAQNEATAAGTQIPAETLSKLVNELTAAWQKLEFVHEGDSQISSTIVHRLTKGDDHFYSQDRREIRYMVDYQGWTDEGSLFQTMPSASDSVESLSSFAAAADNDADVEDTLDAIADPVVTQVTRLYNRTNGDHVWSTDANEVKVLSAQAAWNNEDAAFWVPTYTGSQAVTRLHKGDRHLMSTDSNEVKVLTKAGWTDEGVAFKAY